MAIKKIKQEDEPKKVDGLEGVEEEEADFDPKKVTSDDGDDLHDAYYEGEDDDDEEDPVGVAGEEDNW